MNARTRSLRTLPTLLGLLVFAAGCALRLGGPEPEERTTLALEVEPGTAPAAVAERIRELDANVVLISADADAVWFAEVARLTQLVSSDPGRANGTGFAFLTPDSAVGDTTIALAVEGADSLRVHDALYEIDDDRFLDLMILRIEPGTPLRAAVQSFLQYVATDVMHNAAVAIAVDVADPVRGDSVATLLSPAFADMRECVDEDDLAALPPMQIRLLFGPEVRMGCEWVRVPGPDGRAVLARLVIRR